MNESFVHTSAPSAQVYASLVHMYGSSERVYELSVQMCESQVRAYASLVAPTDDSYMRTRHRYKRAGGSSAATRRREMTLCNLGVLRE